jgi:hypothetical protein
MARAIPKPEHHVIWLPPEFRKGRLDAWAQEKKRRRVCVCVCDDFLCVFDQRITALHSAWVPATIKDRNQPFFSTI